MCAMVKYRSGTRKHSETKKRVLSFLASSPKELALFSSAGTSGSAASDARLAPYPSPTTAPTICSADTTDSS